MCDIEDMGYTFLENTSVEATPSSFLNFESVFEDFFALTYTEDFESDTLSTVPSLQPSSVITEDTEDSGFKEQYENRVAMGSPTMAQVDVDLDLPGTPAGVNPGHGTLLAATPTSTEEDPSVMLV